MRRPIILRYSTDIYLAFETWAVRVWLNPRMWRLGIVRIRGNPYCNRVNYELGPITVFTGW